MPERFEIYIVYKRRYINTQPFLFSSTWQQYPLTFSDLQHNVSELIGEACTFLTY